MERLQVFLLIVALSLLNGLLYPDTKKIVLNSATILVLICVLLLRKTSMTDKYFPSRSKEPKPLLLREEPHQELSSEDELEVEFPVKRKYPKPSVSSFIKFSEVIQTSQKTRDQQLTSEMLIYPCLEHIGLKANRRFVEENLKSNLDKVEVVQVKPSTEKIDQAVEKYNNLILGVGKVLDELEEEEAKKQPPKQPEPPKAEPPKAEPPKAEPPKAEPPKAEPPKAEPPKAEPPKAEPQETQTPKVQIKPGNQEHTKSIKEQIQTYKNNLNQIREKVPPKVRDDLNEIINQINSDTSDLEFLNEKVQKSISILKQLPEDLVNLGLHLLTERTLNKVQNADELDTGPNFSYNYSGYILSVAQTYPALYEIVFVGLSSKRLIHIPSEISNKEILDKRKILHDLEPSGKLSETQKNTLNKDMLSARALGFFLGCLFTRKDSPYSYADCWRWLAYLLNLDPLLIDRYYIQTLQGFLKTAASGMREAYPSQFGKLKEFLKQSYIQTLRKQFPIPELKPFITQLDAVIDQV